MRKQLRSRTLPASGSADQRRQPPFRSDKRNALQNFGVLIRERHIFKLHVMPVRFERARARFQRRIIHRLFERLELHVKRPDAQFYPSVPPAYRAA